MLMETDQGIKAVSGEKGNKGFNPNFRSSHLPRNPILNKQIYFWGIQATGPSIPPISLETVGKLTEFAWSSTWSFWPHINMGFNSENLGHMSHSTRYC